MTSSFFFQSSSSLLNHITGDPSRTRGVEKEAAGKTFQELQGCGKTEQGPLLNSNKHTYINIPIITAQRLNQEARKEDSPINGNPFSCKDRKKKSTIQLDWLT